ncbi:pyridoxine/pyridoxamine 5'-phosphate oxidase [Nocardioides psychrotolerans]|uniref:Pyridoxine/pyridoxamine 5'-phosphate oxidase n=1 Tax=Nocardioides psychrotolerans TaxID=1005945 RepID=A0A1I3HVR6_9ACTN|nr:pyridoxamine 5'-phosphate oxidase [Nocardioides psychrotolerans]GEP38712.1 pyridoxine/pyridoxamine 5'-phosphate oxidase [Nocardioides psychrotolerans]SFI39713.1 Pyridoxamine 5'-phosphate oxidase [Nocardioides psychrotolerans]
MGAESQDETDLASLRRDYAAGGLDEADLAPDPVTMFERWFADAVAGGLHEPNAMVVSTVSAQARPSSRTVLLKGIGPDGFRFYTSLGSRKGTELAANAHCALLFPWHDLERQVRVEGSATLVSRDDVGAYFASRPRGSQLGAWASSQSTPVADRGALESSYDEAELRFPGVVPVPDGWGGYLVRPEVVEFWQGRTGRLHDRLVYRRSGEGWTTQRLAP